MPDSGTPPTPPNADPTKQPSASDAAIEAAARRLSRREIIKDAAEYVKKHISRQPPVQRFFSFMPTMLTRVSPFHFKARIKYKEWPLVRLDSGDANSWGRMQVVGELLVIFDETILFGLLALMTKYQSDAFETTQEELCRLADVPPTATHYSAIWKSIQRLAGTRIDLELFSGKARKRKDLKEMTGSILSFADIDKESGSIRVLVNPYFLEMYAASFVTNIDLKFRARLKSDVSKAFYRFYQGQYERESDIEILRLARAVNLDTDLEIRRLKDKVRSGLKELEQRGYLKAYQITKDNRVVISKSKDAAANFQSQILGLENL
jgi:predicted transcriptional regulator